MNVDVDDRRPGLQPPQFGLAALMVAVTIFASLFALFHYAGMLASVIAIFFLLCVVAHVAGNAIGTQLRDVGSQDPSAKAAKNRFRAAMPNDFAPVTRLRERYSLGKRNVAITLIGTVVGGLLGGGGLLWLGGWKTTWVVAALGFGASAVLGGIWTFAASSFVHVMLGAWFHAAKDLRK
jgi:hypothetical protein